MHDGVIKVLHMTKLGAGGISTLTVNINRCLDLEKVRFDYLVFENEQTFYENEVKKYKAEKRVVDIKKYEKNKFLLYWKKYVGVRALLKQYRYDIVHVDASTPLDVVVGLAAKHEGIRTIILHSHISGDTKHSRFRSFYMNFCKVLMKFTFTDYFAISDSSARFMFPKSIYEHKQYKIWSNGIIADNYIIDLEKRNIIRKKLGISDEFVVGHIGRFSSEKNHEFLVNLFAEFLKKHNNSILLLVGAGPLKGSVEKQCKTLDIEDKVIFYGTTHEIPDVLNAMDTFVFPSKFEGLGIAAIEAQCTGLITFCSDGIPEETNVTDLFRRINGYDVQTWIRKIEKENFEAKRVNKISDVKRAGFDIDTVAREMEEFYIACAKQR